MLSRERGIQHFQKLVHRFVTEAPGLRKGEVK